MKNKWKKAAAFALSLAIVAGSTTSTFFANAAEKGEITITTDTEVADTPTLSDDETESTDEKVDESYFDEETFTLHLKGYVQKSDEGYGIALPDGVDVWYIENIVADEGTVLPEDCSYLFENIPYLFSLDLKNADTSNVTDMTGMFWGLYIEQIDLTGFDTSNVTSMFEMFCHSNINELDFSSFDTSKVTDMTAMFAYSYFNTLDLSSFDTTNVTSMANMFGGCYNLETIYVGDKWSVENIDTDLYGDEDMFYDCIALSGGKGTVFDPLYTNSEYARIDGGDEAPGYLSAVGEKQDLSYFDEKTGTLHLSGYVKNSTNYSGIKLPEGVNKEDVISIVAEEGTVLPANSGAIFYGMINLETVDLKNASSATVRDLTMMFDSCENLVSIDFGDFDTSKVESMYNTFRNCAKLETLDLSSFDTSNVFDFYGIFAGCSSLKAIDLSGFNTSNALFTSAMFSDCASLEEIDLSNFDTTNVFDMYNMFGGCTNLKKVDLSGLDTSNVYYMDAMFAGCASLEEIDLSGFNTKNVYYMNSMFEGCESLVTLDLSKFDTTNVETMASMFAGCSNLTTIYAGSSFIIVKALYNSPNMFEDCYSLVGGKGTTFEPYNTDIEYAHIDGGRLLPGYFTADPNIVENTVKNIADKVKDLFNKYKPLI